jgi:diguanylate cyclase (GGDEF)-like protein
MEKPATPLDETRRLRSLHNLRILDTDPEERFNRITRLARRLFGVPIALVSLVDRDRQWFKSSQGLQACETGREISFCGHAILQEATFVVEDAREDSRFADNPLVTGEPNIRFYAGHPVHGPDGQRVGTLCVIDQQPRTFAPSEIESLMELASMVDRELSLVSQTATDELTKISNRRGFMQIAEHVLALCTRNKLAAAAIAIDLDGFKAINDTKGHEAGDEVLKGFARLLLKQFRDSDVVARFGGDEFCVLMGGTTAEQIRVPLERLQEAFASSALARSHPGLAWSCGVAEFDPAAPRDIDTLLREADRHMYDAKVRSKSARAGSAGGR